MGSLPCLYNSFDLRADYLRCRRGLVLGHRQVRERRTARESAQDPRGADLSRGNFAAGAPFVWSKRGTLAIIGIIRGPCNAGTACQRRRLLSIATLGLCSL